ncbi:hypothetical protein [Nesterenkonia sp. F]|uniref:hypothetical protein n=1 Tax=Nesterenkonia sp. F TaxID=795955 RepID=UPI000255D0DC|nr:hypothetical protein [Nesterenkonia sp. F]
MDDLWIYLSVLAPSVGVGLIFWLAMRAIFRADRGERAAEAEIRREVAAQPGEESGEARRVGPEEPHGDVDSDAPSDTSPR